MLARLKIDPGLRDPLERLPAPGLRHRHRAGDIHAVDFDVERDRRGGGVDLRRADGDVVLAVGGDVYGIGEPLPSLEVVDGVTTADRLGGGNDVDVLGGAELPVAEVALGQIVIGDGFAAF